MTEAEALRYAVEWLMAFPALPMASRDYQERRDAAVERLEAMLRRAEEQATRDAASERARAAVFGHLPDDPIITFGADSGPIPSWEDGDD